MNKVENKIVSISSKELERMKSRKIGEGRDAKVYNAGNGLLYKVYKEPEFTYYGTSLLDSEGVRIDKVNPEVSKYNKENLTYYDSEGVKIYSSDSIRLASTRQERIKNTTLPLCPLYIDNRFKGCVLKYHRFCIDLHRYMDMVPLKSKIKVLKNVLRDTKELVDNFIYPTDLSNRSGGLEDNGFSHSNILVTPKRNIEIIDLDGRSTTYTEKEDKYLYDLVYNGLATLFIETLFDSDLSDNMGYDDLSYIEYKLKSMGLPSELAYSLVDRSYVTEDELNSVISLIEHKKLKL